MRNFLVILVIVVAGFGSNLNAQERPACYPEITEEPIILDGILSEPVWQKAKRITDFTQRELNIGEKATERTEVAVAYDANFLYVAAWCFDSSPDRIRSKELARDFAYDRDDNFIFILDTYHDKRNGFLFVTNPSAARMDAQVFNNGSSVNQFWDGVWDVRTQINADGWFAEFRIPLYTLKYRTQLDVQDWGINFERNIRRKREQVRWTGWQRDFDITHVNQAGNLIGLKNLRNRQFVEVKPYGIGGAQWEQGERNTLINGGGDINYLLSPAYRLNITVNTDFAQVESDQQQVNITRFPLFFPELRPFFLEGADYFDMGYGGNRITPFYSRRIGLDENRESVPILAGARLLGKENNRTLGLMTIQTGATDGTPTKNFTVGSWRQDVGEQSVIGAMSVNTFESDRWHTTTGIRGNYRTARLFGNKNFNVGGALVHTHSSDTSWNAQAYAYRAYMTYFNDKWDVIVTTQKSPEPFEPEVGLMRRRNFRENFGFVKFKPRPKKDGKLGWIRQFDLSPGAVTLTQYNDNYELQSFEYSVKFMGFETRGGEAVGAEYRRRAEGLRDPFRLSDSIVIAPGEYWWNEWRFSASSFDSRTFSVNAFLSIGEFYTGMNTRYEGSLTWRAGKHLRVSMRYQDNNIRMPDGNLNTSLFGTRLDYAINPNAFGAVIGQYNSVENEYIFNFRLRWIPVIGTDFFLIVNQVYRPDSNGQLASYRSAVLGKLIWRFVL
jgi:hypothetical protein